MSKIKRILFTLAAALGLLAPVATPALVSAQDIRGSLCKGANLKATGNCDETSLTGSGAKVDGMLKTAIDLFSLVVGVIAVIMIIVGGVKYITSGGDSGNVTGAKNTILYAVVGLVVVALAQVIVRFVLSNVAK